MPQIKRISPRFGTALEWTVADPVLDLWEIGEESDTGLAKRGDGVTAWTSLPYWGASIATLQSVIANDPIATSIPTLQNGATFGADNGTPVVINLKGGIAGAGNTSITSVNGALALIVDGDIAISVDIIGYTADEMTLNGEFVSHIHLGGYSISTNTPTLADGDTNANGYEAILLNAGTRDFGSGNITFGIGDVIAKLDDVYYKKVDNNQSGGGDLLAANNLSDLDNSDTALTNLGLTATATELNYTDGVTSNVQTQIDAKVSSTATGEPTGSDQVINMVSLTQAEYDAGTPVATTFYVITDA